MRKATPPFKATLFAAALLACPALVNAQYYWDAGFSIGAANYLGDMGGNALTRRDFVSDMKLSETRTSAGAFVRYKINPSFSVKANVSWARISGDDKLSSNPARNARNLSFRNDLVEATAMGQFFFYEINDLGRTHRHKDNFRAYVGLGAGAVYHNPKTTWNGEWVALRPLTTEGRRYTTVAAVIPASAGFYFTFNKQYRIGWDLTWRTTFTDYLDDVSTRYAEPSALPSALAIELANRTDELTGVEPAFAENFTPGNKRGDSRHNDSYLTTSVEFSYAFRGHSSVGKPRYPWIHDKPDKYNGPSKRRGTLYHVIRKKRYRF